MNAMIGNNEEYNLYYLLWYIVKSWGSEATHSANLSFNRSFKISNPPWLDALHSFAATIWLLKGIFYIKNHSNIPDFFSVNNNRNTFFVKVFFDNFNCWTTLFSKIIHNFRQSCKDDAFNRENANFARSFEWMGRRRCRFRPS